MANHLTPTELARDR